MTLQLKLFDDSNSPVSHLQEPVQILAKVREFIDQLNADDIRYCHWKSNAALAESLAGQTDIDLLVHRSDAGRFRTIVAQLHFHPATTTAGDHFPSMEHYYALDKESGILVHVHVYFRVITGESLTKNYHFPVEELLLQNRRLVGAIWLPTKSAELVVFTLRMMLKHTSFVELALISRYWKGVNQEAKWLLQSDSAEKSLSFVRTWLPAVDTNLFSDCIDALASPAPVRRRIALAFQLRSQLKPYARRSAFHATMIGLQKFAVLFFRRAVRSQKSMVPLNGGVVIAFVGSEATGKSTLIGEMSAWLGEHFTVQHIHVGKPKSTLLSLAPNIIVPALRRLLPTSRSTQVESHYTPAGGPKNIPADYPLIFGIRSVLLAHDRRTMLARAFAQATDGTIVLCDRYPSLQSGAPDSPQLAHIPISANGRSLRRKLTDAEARLYREIPAPDLIIYLRAPLDVTVARNASRGKREPEDYVRRRHTRSSNLDFGHTPVYEVDTNQSFDETVLEVRNAIWSIL